MTETQRRAYLEAIGIGVWVSNAAARDPDRWIVGAGSGCTLLLCRTAEESGSMLAADIGRSLGGDPAWAWPDPDSGPDCPSLRELIDQHLFTRVLLFGGTLAGQVFKGSTPEVEGTASVLVTSSLDELAVDGKARRELWQCLFGASSDPR